MSRMIDHRLLSWRSIAAALLFTLLLHPCHLTVGATIRTAVSYCFSFDPAGKIYMFSSC